MTEPAQARPKRVVVVDADNPFVEVRDEFFWREDHDHLLAEAQSTAYRSGYAAGALAAVTRQRQPAEIVVRRRPRLGGRLLRLFALAVMLLVVVPLVTGVLLSRLGLT